MPLVLSHTDIEHFNEQGYLAVDGLLDEKLDIQPVRDEYEALLDRLCEDWQARGLLTSAYRGLPFGQRLIQVYREAGQDYCQHIDITLPQTGIDADTPFHVGPAVFRLLTSPRLLDAVEDLIGPEIYSNPVQHVRIKVPERFVDSENGNPLNRTSSWHQDQGVVLPEADESDILTVWLAVTPATVENGCLKVIPRQHRDDLVFHCPGVPKGKGFHIPDLYLHLEDTVPVPLQPGGVLFMHRRTPHSSYTNTSDDIRWSFDLRYNPTAQPTGRPMFPGFVARSRSNPASALTDPDAWAHMWRAARERLAEKAKPTFNRWTDSPEVCA
jgi:hypothetical protein